MKESQIQRSILEYLAAKGILAFRMNTGATSAEHNGKTRFMRFGVAGMADILSFTEKPGWMGTSEITPLWIEVKTATGKQSELQKSFQKQVQWHGHKYVVARSIEDIQACL